jgi:hypothetical protein
MRPENDDDVGPARSIYDGPDDDADPLYSGLDDDAARRAFDADKALMVADQAADWTAAAQDCVERFVAAVAGLARLDERLRLMDPGARRAALERLAVVQAARLMWAQGDPVDPWAMALDAALRRGRAGDDAPAMTQAHRLARRLVAPRAAVDGWAADLPDPAPGGHRLLRAAALEQALRRAGDAAAEAAVAAMRLAAQAAGGGRALGGQGDGARFAPLPARRRHAGPEPAATLDAFLGDVADGAADARATLVDLAAWRVRADAIAAAMKGTTPVRLVALLARRPALGAPEAAQALGLSDSAASRALDRLAEAGVAREMTGQGRFRAWTAKV